MKLQIYLNNQLIHTVRLPAPLAEYVADHFRQQGYRVELTTEQET